jgi:hypothetical protein
MSDQTEKLLAEMAEEEEEEVVLITVTAEHTVQVTYRLWATGLDDALDQLCGTEVFTSVEQDNAPNIYGVDEGVLAQIGAEIVEEFHFSDPGPTGEPEIVQGWEWDEAGDSDEDSEESDEESEDTDDEAVNP